MASKQESVWILRAQCGDRDAFELLLRRVQPSLDGCQVGLVGPSDADDVLQEVLLQIYRRLTCLENPALFRLGRFGSPVAPDVTMRRSGNAGDRLDGWLRQIDLLRPGTRRGYSILSATHGSTPAALRAG